MSSEEHVNTQSPVRSVSKANKEAFSDGLSFLRYLHDSDRSYNLPYIESCITAQNFQKILQLLPMLTSPKQLVNLVGTKELVNDILDLVQLTFEEPQLKERITVQTQQTGIRQTMETLSTANSDIESWNTFHVDSLITNENEVNDIGYWSGLLGQENDASSDEEFTEDVQ